MGSNPIIRSTHRRVAVKETAARSLGLTILRPQSPLCEVNIDSLWFEESLAPDWTLALRLVVQTGRIVVAEVRIFPTEPNALIPGQWSAELRGEKAMCPEGGLTTRMVRRVKLGTISQHITAILAQAAKQKKPLRDPKGIDDMLDRVKSKTGVRPEVATEPRPGKKEEDYHYFGQNGTFGERGITSPSMPIKTGAKRGPRPADDTIYLRIAEFYAKRIASGSHRPSSDVATRFRLTPAKARMMIHTARQRDFLSRLPTPELKHGQQGQAGGQLTDRAKALLSHQTKSNKSPHTRRHRTEKPKPRKGR